MANADFERGTLELTDPAGPSPANPSQITHFDDYIVQPSIPGSSVTINLNSDNTGNYDPLLQVYQLSPGQNVPLAGQSPIVQNDDFGGTLNSSVTFTSQGSSRYLVRVTSFNAMPDPNIPPTRTLPAPYSLTAQVNLGDIALQPSGDNVIGGPDDDTLGGGQRVARYWDTLAGSHFFTSDPSEQQNTNGNSRYSPEGFEFLSEGDVTLRRYVNSQGGYFYASNPGEIAFVNTLQEWRADPSVVQIQVYSSPQVGTSPVFRAYNLDTNGHFYTIDPNQAAFADSLPDFRLEPGVAFYAKPA